MREMLDGSLGGHIHIEMKFGEEVWPVEIDAGEMELAVLNLCLNARDAVAGGGTVTIAAENVVIEEERGSQKQWVKLSVTDTGCGMAGIKVDDGRLEEARWRFLHGLWLDPLDPEALNGLGTIAWFGHDLDTAEFFVRAALRRLPDYENAKHDLALILDLKRRSQRPSKRRA